MGLHFCKGNARRARMRLVAKFCKSESVNQDSRKGSCFLRYLSKNRTGSFPSTSLASESRW
jgi:hypothetical protein